MNCQAVEPRPANAILRKVNGTDGTLFLDILGRQSIENFGKDEEHAK